jgi:hypothetical protein
MSHTARAIEAVMRLEADALRSGYRSGYLDGIALAVTHLRRLSADGTTDYLHPDDPGAGRRRPTVVLRAAADAIETQANQALATEGAP